MNRLPNTETIQRGTLCKKPTLSMALTSSEGSAADSVTAPPMLFMDADTTLPQMEKIAVISSMPRPAAHLCQHKADEMTQRKLRPLQFPEGCRRGKDADCKEQHQQAVADPHKSGVDVDDHTPDLPALKGFRRLRNQLPQLRQLIVPGGNGIFEVSYDPVITYGLHLTFTKSFQ